MKFKALGYVCLILLCAIISFTFGILKPFQDSQAASGNLTENFFIPVRAAAADLENVGFVNVKKAEPQGDRFPAHIDYFFVGDDAAGTGIGNLAMVYSGYHVYIDSFSESALYPYGTDSHALDIPGATGRSATIADGRTAVNFIKGNNYTVIIGPDKEKIEALAREIAKRVR